MQKLSHGFFGTTALVTKAAMKQQKLQMLQHLLTVPGADSLSRRMVSDNMMILMKDTNTDTNDRY